MKRTKAILILILSVLFLITNFIPIISSNEQNTMDKHSQSKLQVLGGWEKWFGGEEVDEGCSVQQTTDGGYIIAGYTQSFGAGVCDVWLIKTDSNGNKQWDKTFGGESYDAGYSVRQTIDGGYIITGNTRSFGAGNWDVYLIKTDSNGNEQPNKPIINGPTTGKPRTEYTYTISATDSDVDDISYYVDWSDGINTGWSGWYSSGTELFFTHEWGTRGSYQIKAKVKDEYGLESDWATLEVSMPKNKAINTPSLQFLENHPYMFPVLRYLMKL